MAGILRLDLGLYSVVIEVVVGCPCSYAGIMLLTCQLGWLVTHLTGREGLYCLTLESTAEGLPPRLVTQFSRLLDQNGIY